MADEQKDQNQNKRPKSIDVTKPRENRGAPISNLDASRVSEHTLREQQALEKLKKQVGTLDRHENRASKLKTIIAIVLVLLLIVI